MGRMAGRYSLVVQASSVSLEPEKEGESKKRQEDEGSASKKEKEKPYLKQSKGDPALHPGFGSGPSSDSEISADPVRGMGQAADRLISFLEASCAGDKEFMSSFAKGQLIQAQAQGMKVAVQSAAAYISAKEKGIELPLWLLAALEGRDDAC